MLLNLSKQLKPFRKEICNNAYSYLNHTDMIVLDIEAQSIKSFPKEIKQLIHAYNGTIDKKKWLHVILDDAALMPG